MITLFSVAHAVFHEFCPKPRKFRRFAEARRLAAGLRVVTPRFRRKWEAEKWKTPNRPLGVGGKLGRMGTWAFSNSGFVAIQPNRKKTT